MFRDKSKDGTTRIQGGSRALDAYPVGALYLSVNSTDPGTFFGGTWVAFGTGRMPIGVDASDTSINASEKTGGARTVTLTAAQSGLRDHGHGVTAASVRTFAVTTSSTASIPHTRYDGVSAGATQANGEAQVGLTIGIGSSGAFDAVNPHENTPPFISVYMFKRTA